MTHALSHCCWCMLEHSTAALDHTLFLFVLCVCHKDTSLDPIWLYCTAHFISAHTTEQLDGLFLAFFSPLPNLFNFWCSGLHSGVSGVQTYFFGIDNVVFLDVEGGSLLVFFCTILWLLNFLMFSFCLFFYFICRYIPEAHLSDTLDGTLSLVPSCFYMCRFGIPCDVNPKKLHRCPCVIIHKTW